MEISALRVPAVVSLGLCQILTDELRRQEDEEDSGPTGTGMGMRTQNMNPMDMEKDAAAPAAMDSLRLRPRLHAQRVHHVQPVGAPADERVALYP